MHGPPGCGKTLLANAIAGELGVPFLRISAPEIVSGMSGESEQKVSAIAPLRSSEIRGYCLHTEDSGPAVVQPHPCPRRATHSFPARRDTGDGPSDEFLVISHACA